MPALHLPRVPAADVLGPAQLREAHEVGGLLRWLQLGSQGALLVAFLVYARNGAVLARESAAGRIGTGMLLAMLGFGVAWLVQVPFDVVSLWWQRDHGLAHDTYWELVLGSFLGLGGTFLFVCLGVLITMGIARWLPRRWWVVGGPVFVALGLLQAFASPYLTPGTHPLRSIQIAAEVRRLQQDEGLPRVPVDVQEVSAETDAPNAEALGVGGSRRIVLWDTLLDGRFSDQQVEVVIAHELGHVARNHVLRSVGWLALIALPASLLVAVATRRRGGMREPAAVPVALLVFIGLTVLLQPLQSLVTRHMEREADWIALQATRDPAAARALFRGLARTTSTDPSPPTWDYVLYQDHPTIAQRLAMVDAWEAWRASRVP